MGTYVPPLGPQNFISKQTVVTAAWLNVVDSLVQGQIPADGPYVASIVSGQVQVTGPNGYITSYGDMTFALQGPNPSGVPSPTLYLGGAGKQYACITTDAQIPGIPGISLIIASGESDDPTQPSGNLLLIGGGGDTAVGSVTLQGCTSVNGPNGGLTAVWGGNATKGIAGNLYLGGGQVGPLGGGSVHLIMTDTGNGTNPGTIVFRVDSTVLWTINAQGALFFGATGAGAPGEVFTSQGPNSSPVWAPPGISAIRTPAEIAVDVFPSNYAYPEGDLRRYGGDPSGTTDSSAAWQSAISVGIVRIPANCSFQILTPATRVGQVVIIGEGPTSKLLADSDIMTIFNGTESFVDNFWMENITTPYIIIRDPTNWGAAIVPVQSNAVGYQPTTNDPEYNTWLASFPQIGPQNIGPSINFSGAASNITVSRIYGRFVRINMFDTVSSTVRDCDFQGGRGLFGALLWDNCSNNIQRGVNNKSINNRIYAASQCAITSISNDDFVYEGNECFLNGQSGLQTGQTSGFFLTASPSFQSSATMTAPYNGPTANDYGVFFDNGEVRQNVTLTNGSTAISWNGTIAAGAGIQIAAWGHSQQFNNSTMATVCLRGQIVGNRAYWNYYDGLDCDSTFGTTNGAFRTYHQICDNYSYQNRGDGINIDGQFGNVSGNTVYLNGSFGIWGICQYTKINDNMMIDNNQLRNPALAEILAVGGPANKISDNFFYGGPSQNCAAIAVTQQSVNYITDNVGVGISVNNVGNLGQIASVYDDNIDNTVAAATDQSFMFRLVNNGGVLQHIIFADLSQQSAGKQDRIIGNTSSGFITTPTGPDITTPFAGGAKIGSSVTNAIWFNTAPQPISTVRILACIVLNTTGVALTVIPMIMSVNVNGVLAQRLTYQFVNAATGAPFALNTTNIPPGKEIDIQFYGKLS